MRKSEYFKDLIKQLEKGSKGQSSWDKALTGSSILQDLSTTPEEDAIFEETASIKELVDALDGVE